MPKIDVTEDERRRAAIILLQHEAEKRYIPIDIRQLLERIADEYLLETLKDAFK